MPNLITITTLILGFIIYILSLYKSEVFANYFGLIDKPNKFKIHSNPTPLVGILPIFSMFSFFFLSNLATNFQLDYLLIFITTTVFFLIGIIDDKTNLNAYFKLFLSTSILILFLYFSKDLKLEFLYSETFDKGLNLNNSILSIFFTVLCILLLTNSLNLSDGINSLASGISTIWLFVLTILVNDQIKIYLLALTILMILNTYFIYKGKFFLGDSGTLFLGSFVSLLTVLIYNKYLNINITISVEKIFMFFIVPGIDMLRLFIVRIINFKDPFKGDLNHLHHYLLKYFSLNTTLIIYWGLVISNIILAYKLQDYLYLAILFNLILYCSFLIFWKI